MFHIIKTETNNFLIKLLIYKLNKVKQKKYSFSNLFLILITLFILPELKKLRQCNMEILYLMYVKTNPFQRKCFNVHSKGKDNIRIF